MEKLYRVNVNLNAYYFVRCEPNTMAKWLDVLAGEGRRADVVVTEVNVSDLDEISCVHFC